MKALIGARLGFKQSVSVEALFLFDACGNVKKGRCTTNQRSKPRQQIEPDLDGEELRARHLAHRLCKHTSKSSAAKLTVLAAGFIAKNTVLARDLG